MKAAAAPMPDEDVEEAGNSGLVLSTLFAHLVSLGSCLQAENTQRLGPADLPSQGIPITVEGTIPVANSGTARIIAVTPTSSGSINPFFERDAADVLHWMRNAIETIHVDSLVVTSAASLALHYLRLGAPRGLAQPRSRSTNDATSASRTISGRLRMGSGARKNRRSNMKQRKVKSKRITDPVSRVSARLLSVTTLTLASKYHDVYEKAVQDFGARVEPSRIYRLGLEIALSDSLGTALTASFRANAVAFHNLFCDMANQTAVVRACSEWFAVSLALLSPPQDNEGEDEGEERRGHVLITPRRQRQHHQDPLHHAPSPTSSPATTTATMTPASSINTPAATVGVGDKEYGRGQHAEVRAWSASSEESRSSSGLTREVGLALTAVVLARRLSRSPGPCLPMELRSVLGLDHHEETLKLVAQGITVARRTLKVKRGKGAGADIVNSGRTAGGPGSVFAGELVFDQTVDHVRKARDSTATTSLESGVHTDSMSTSSAFKVRLLELLTPEYDDEMYLPQSPNDHKSELTAAERKASSPDMSRLSANGGSSTTCTSAAVGIHDACEDAVSLRTNRGVCTSMRTRTPGNGISIEGSSLTYSSSSSNSRFNTSRVAENGKIASTGTRGKSEADNFAEEFMPKSDASSASHACLSSPWSPLRNADPRSGSQRDCAPDEHSQVLTDRENSYCSSSGGGGNSNSNSSRRSNSHNDSNSGSGSRSSTSWFDYEAVVRAAAEHAYDYRSSSDDGDISSSLLLPSPAIPSRTAAEIAPPTPDTWSADEWAVEVDNKKKWGGDDDGKKYSRKRRDRTEEVLSTSTAKKVRINEWSVRCRPLHQGVVRSAEEERFVRWDILTNRIHMALEYDCGCSFCQLGMAVVVMSTSEREGRKEELQPTATELSVLCDKTVTASTRSPEFLDCGQNSDVDASGVVAATSNITMSEELEEGDTSEATARAAVTGETAITETQAETMKGDQCNQRYPGRPPTTFVGSAVDETIAGGVQLPADMEVPDFSVGVPIAAGTRQQEEEIACSSGAKRNGIPSIDPVQNSGERDDAGKTGTYYPAADTSDSSVSLSSWMIPAFVARTAGKTIVLNDATGGALFGDTCTGGGDGVGAGAADQRNGVTRKEECIP